MPPTPNPHKVSDTWSILRLSTNPHPHLLEHLPGPHADVRQDRKGDVAFLQMSADGDHSARVEELIFQRWFSTLKNVLHLLP